MKLPKIFGTVALAGLLFTAGGCDSLADLNVDPNKPEDVPESLMLPALESNFSFQIIGNTAARIPAQWVQQLAYSRNPPSASNYVVSENDVNNLWEHFAYTDVLKNARVLADKATANGNHDYAGIAKILEAWTLSVVTDLWGSAPYSEAFDVYNTTPGYDSQEEIYVEIFRLLDEAVASIQLESRLAPDASSDLLYGGDMAKWERLAYSLEARFHMRLSRAPGNGPAARSAQALTALQNAFAGNADDADFAYYDAIGAENPWNQWTISRRFTTAYQLSAFYVGLLESLDDPRLAIQARPVGAVNNFGPVANFSTDDPQYVGQPSGEAGMGADNVSSIGTFYSDPDAALTWISYASTKFVEAEATYYAQGAAAAQSVYEEAIRASMAKLGVDETDADFYIAFLPELTDAGVNALEEIMTQKYIANFLDPEAYHDWRRNGYPALTPVTNQAAVNVIPLRFPYPGSEITRNAASVEATGIPRGHEAMTLPVWWDTTIGVAE